NDLPDSFRDPNVKSSKEWLTYWRGNPVKAWLGDNLRSKSAAHFQLIEDKFAAKVAVDPAVVDTLQKLVQEIIDFRLASYENRQRILGADNVVPLHQPSRPGTALPYFPNIKIACGHFKTGKADAEEYRILTAA